jgi:hypothetical protein
VAESLTFCTSFLSLRQYVEQKQGAGSFKRVRAALAAEHGIELPAVITPGSWLPTLHFTTGMNVARTLFGPPNFHELFGAAAAEYELRWVHRVILRFTSPLWMLERADEVWNKAHTTGRWEIAGSAAQRTMRGTLYDFGVVDKGYCDSLRGWITRACLMTGTHRIAVLETSCRARGAAGCTFEGRWE